MKIQQKQLNNTKKLSLKDFEKWVKFTQVKKSWKSLKMGLKFDKNGQTEQKNDQKLRKNVEKWQKLG